jgi:hypothetical protein
MKKGRPIQCGCYIRTHERPRALCDICKDKKRIASKKHYDKNGNAAWTKKREALFGKYGDKCAKCGFTDKRALQFDHIQNDGASDRKNMGQYSLMKKMLEATSLDYQVLCANCNFIKEAEKREMTKDGQAFSRLPPRTIP